MLRQPCLGAPDVETAPCPPAARRWVLAATILASSMIFIDGSVVAVALPAIREDLGASLTEAQWILNAYVLMLAAFTLIGGAAADRFGRRRVFLVGVAAFAVASAACAAARTVELLAAARVLQGVAGAILAPASLAVIGSIYPEEERGQAIGLWAGASALATAGGPLIGGLIVDYAHWSLIFLLNLPIAAAAAAAAWRHLPESRHAGPREPLDWPGAVLAATGFGGVAWGLVALGEGDTPRDVVFAALVLGAAGLWAFVWREGRAAAPMMPLELYRSRAFSGVTGMTGLMYAALSAAFFLLPFVLIDSRGWSASAVGLVFAPFTIAVGLLSGVAGRVSDRWGPRPGLVVGPVLAAVGFAWLALAPAQETLGLEILLPMAVLGVGFAITIAPLTAVALAAAPAEREGAASGVNNAAARAAGLVGAAIAAAAAPEDARAEGLEAAFRIVMIGAAAAAVAAAVIAARTAPGRRAD